jgi:hypothetical protein
VIRTASRTLSPLRPVLGFRYIPAEIAARKLRLASKKSRKLLSSHQFGIFGIPGDFVLPFFKVIEESSILPFYTLSHEPAVGFADDAAARYHSGVGVAVVSVCCPKLVAAH